MSKVYFSKDVNKFFQLISKEYNKDVGIKIHFGEKNNTTHIDPKLLHELPKYFSKPTFIECNVLYRGQRTTKKEHLNLAKKHGFGFLPIDILDGETGEDFFEVEVDGHNCKLGKGLQKYRHCISIAHFKGHLAAGFGAALKNVGMGLGSRAGKMDMHSFISPVIGDKCIACGTCAKECPADAIVLDGKARILREKCIGCAHCIAICPVSAIHLNWAECPIEKLMEKIAIYVKAAMQDRRWWFINFLTDITLDCDCMDYEQKPIMEDIGILYSKDPAALDKASYDLFLQKAGKDLFKEHNHIEGLKILDYAEKLGIGKKEYELIEL